MNSYWFVLRVNPVPWTAPEVAIGRKGGKVYPMVFSPEELRNYKEAIREELEKELEERHPEFVPIEDEIGLEFYFVRNIAVDATNARRRTHVADATNLQKSTEDALQGLLFVNDSQVVHVQSVVIDQSEDAIPAVAIRLIWHPTLPKLPPEIDKQMTKTIDVAAHAEDNVHDVNIEELF